MGLPRSSLGVDRLLFCRTASIRLPGMEQCRNNFAWIASFDICEEFFFHRFIRLHIPYRADPLVNSDTSCSRVNGDETNRRPQEPLVAFGVDFPRVFGDESLSVFNQSGRHNADGESFQRDYLKSSDVRPVNGDYGTGVALPVI